MHHIAAFRMYLLLPLLLAGIEVESELESESIFSGRSRSQSHLKSVDSAALGFTLEANGRTMKFCFLLYEYITKNIAHVETIGPKFHQNLCVRLKDIAEKAGPRESEAGGRWLACLPVPGKNVPRGRGGVGGVPPVSPG